MPLLSSKGKRSFTYSIIILFILGIFASGYIFYFMPHNRETIHKNGFLILQAISTNVENAAKSRVTFYTNLIKNSNGEKETIDTLIKKNNIEADVKIIELNDSVIKSLQIADGKLVASINFSGKKIIQVSESIDKFLEPLLSSQKSELFELYTLQKINGNRSELIYQDEELAIRTDIGADSLLPKAGGSFVAGIRDLTSKNVDLKMFYYPFTIENSSFIISGFVEAEKYDQSIRRIPFYFVYPLVIVFLLMLILFPVIKFYLMDSNEQLRVNDVIFFGVSSILGASLLTILIIYFLLWKGEEKRIEKNLVNISGEIKTAFNNEIKKAYREIEVIDSFKKANLHPEKDLSDPVRSFLKQSNPDTSGYFHFDRISWVDSSGNQVAKAELYSDPVFTNVGDRKYVQVFKTGTPYFLPGSPGKRFGWEPIYSWTNGDFNISVSMKSGDSIVAMATKMYSLVQTIMPAGYGFCIIDDEGNVQVHSDGNRNLRENFLEKTNRAEQIKGVMASRQFKIINYVVAYDKLHMMAVQPLDNSMPYYLVSFYDEGYIVPVTIRILIFTLLLSSLFFIVCGILWWAVGRKGSTAHPLVYCKMDFIDWVTPKTKEGNYYFHGFAYTLVYSVSLIAFAIFNRHYDISNFNILALLILTPLNIIMILYCMRSAFNRVKKRKAIIDYALVHLVITMIFFFLVKKTYPLTAGFLVFQLVINAFMWIYRLSDSNSPILSFRSPFSFLKGYKLLITSLVICLAVLPASLFTWYAHNQEITQIVKRQQLYLANQLRERSYVIQRLNPAKDALLPGFYFDSLRFSYGVYKINGDRVTSGCDTNKNKRGTGFEKFYFDIAEEVSAPYYKKQSYAALQDEASDTSWHWLIKNNDIHFWYQPGFPRRNINQDKPAQPCLQIISAMPDRFVYLTKEKYFPIAVLIVLLVIGLFKWLGKNTEQIFLTRFIYSWKEPADKATGLIAAFFAGKTLPVNERLYTPQRYKDYTRHCDREELLIYEKELVGDMNNGKELFNYVWDNCTEKEKFLLYGFAHDGTINYKNSKEIIELMNKGIFVVKDERLRIFSPAFRAFILYSVNNEEVVKLQKEHRQNSSWQYIRVPLMILLLGIAALVFFTQQGIFDKILVLAGGVSTLIGLMTKFFTGDGSKIKT